MMIGCKLGASPDMKCFSFFLLLHVLFFIFPKIAKQISFGATLEKKKRNKVSRYKGHVFFGPPDSGYPKMFSKMLTPGMVAFHSSSPTPGQVGPEARSISFVFLVCCASTNLLLV